MLSNYPFAILAAWLPQLPALPRPALPCPLTCCCPSFCPSSFPPPCSACKFGCPGCSCRFTAAPPRQPADYLAHLGQCMSPRVKGLLMLVCICAALPPRSSLYRRLRRWLSTAVVTFQRKSHAMPVGNSCNSPLPQRGSSICSAQPLPFDPLSCPAPAHRLCTTMSVHNTTREGNGYGHASSSDSFSNSGSASASHSCPVPPPPAVPRSASCCACIVLMLFVKLQGGDAPAPVEPWSRGAVEPWSHCAVLQRVSFFANVCNAHTKRKERIEHTHSHTRTAKRHSNNNSNSSKNNKHNKQILLNSELRAGNTRICIVND